MIFSVIGSVLVVEAVEVLGRWSAGGYLRSKDSRSAGTRMGPL